MLVTAISGWFRLLPHCSGCDAGITCVQAFNLVVPGFDGLDGVFKRLFQNPPADGPEYEAEQPPVRFLPSRMTTTSISVVPLG